MIQAFFWQLTNWFSETISFPKVRKKIICAIIFCHSKHSFKGNKNFTWNMIRKSISASRIGLAHVASEKKYIWGFLLCSITCDIEGLDLRLSFLCPLLSPTFAMILFILAAETGAHNVMPFASHYGMLFQWLAIECNIKLFIRQLLEYRV